MSDASEKGRSRAVCTSAAGLYISDGLKIRNTCDRSLDHAPSHDTYELTCTTRHILRVGCICPLVFSAYEPLRAPCKGFYTHLGLSVTSQDRNHCTKDRIAPRRHESSAGSRPRLGKRTCIHWLNMSLFIVICSTW